MATWYRDKVSRAELNEHLAWLRAELRKARATLRRLRAANGNGSQRKVVLLSRIELARDTVNSLANQIARILFEQAMLEGAGSEPREESQEPRILPVHLLRAAAILRYFAAKLELCEPRPDLYQIAALLENLAVADGDEGKIQHIAVVSLRAVSPS